MTFKGDKMSRVFHLPDLGEGVQEAEILHVAVTVGQQVEEGDLILEIETDKAAVEIPSPFTGTISEILVKTGDMPRVGDILIQFSTPGEDENVLAADHPADHPTEQQPAIAAPSAPSRGAVIPAAPSTRRRARELGVDLAAVPPTGRGGIVSREDVELFAKSKAGPGATAAQGDHHPAPEPDSTVPSVPPEADISSTGKRTTVPSGEVERRPFRSIRRATAKQMARSWAEIPHVHCEDVVDITLLEEFRQKHKEPIREIDGRLTMTVFAIKALATALKQYPLFNSSLDLEKQEIIVKKYFNIGVAADSENGLVVPVIKDVDRKSIRELSVELHECISRVRKGTHTREEMLGGTFTITNAGALGGNRFSAIINHPQVAILGLGEGRWQPAVVHDDRGKREILPRLIMPIVLCFDHRVVDGGDAIKFLKVIISALEDPDELLISMI